MKYFLAAIAVFGICQGPLPAKPAVPAGCRDLVPICVCDDKGNNCRWEYICVG